MAYKNRKIILLSEKEMSVWHDIIYDAKYNICMCKFSQIEIAKSALLGTMEAEIWNIGPRIKTLKCKTLEKVRGVLFENCQMEVTKNQ